MKILSQTANTMDKTIRAIERHMTPKPANPLVRAGFQPFGGKLVAEWQQRAPETLSGHALRKLRLGFAPPQSVTIASAAG